MSILAYLAPNYHNSHRFVNVITVTTNCNCVTATVTKEGTNWLGQYDNCIIINYECPYDYCTHSLL